MRKIILAGLLAFLGYCSPSFAAQDVTLCAAGTNASSSDSCAHLLQPQASTVVESSHVFKNNGPATAVDFQVNNISGSVVWVMLFDAASAPSAGAVTSCSSYGAARPCVAKWYQVAANSTIGVSWSPGPFLQLQTGQVIACSSTGPFTLTYSSNCIFSGEAM